MTKENLLKELSRLATSVASHKDCKTSMAYELSREVWKIWWEVYNNKERN